jgi:hypothetical protein
MLILLQMMLSSCTKDLQPNPYNNYTKTTYESRKMNDNFKLDIGYIAGLFDAKGIVKRSTKTKWHWKMEMSMADRNVMEVRFMRTLKCGELRKIKKQWRWTCFDKNCFFVARELWAHTTVKLHKIEEIIDYMVLIYKILMTM